MNRPAGGTSSTASAIGAANSTRAKPAPSALPAYALIAAAVFLVLAVIIVFASNGSAKKEAVSAKAEVKTIPAQRPPEPPAPVASVKRDEPNPVERHVQAPPPPPSAPEPAPVTRLQPPPRTIETAPVAPPPPDTKKLAGSGEIEYGPWEDLIKNNSLEGWEFYKGKWDVVDGVIVSTETTAKGATLQSTPNFDNFELHFKLWIENVRWVETQIRSYGNVWLLHVPPKTWQDVTIVANGASAHCTLSSGEVELAEDANGNPNGNLCFYIHKDGIVKIKDMKLRTIKTK